MAEPAPLPPLVKHCKWCAPLRLQCPACDERFCNSIWQQLAYAMHYATAHLGIRVFRDTRHRNHYVREGYLTEEEAR